VSTPESLLRSIQVRASSRSSKTPPGNCELPLKHQIVVMSGLWNFNLAAADGQIQRRSMPSGRLASSGTHVGHNQPFMNVCFGSIGNLSPYRACSFRTVYRAGVAAEASIDERTQRPSTK